MSGLILVQTVRKGYQQTTNFATGRQLALCIRETFKRVHLQIVKTQIKCSIMLHFIRVYTVFKGKKELQKKKEYNVV